MYFYRDPNTLVTVACALAITVAMEPVLKGNRVIFAVALGALVPLLDGLLWGKERWGQHPIVYVVVGIVFFLLQYFIGRENRAFGSFYAGSGMVLMQSFLYYTGKLGKDD